MNLLLDTNCFIWFINGDKSLPQKIKTAILSYESNCYLSIASLWEIAIKQSLGKLELNGSFYEIEGFLTDNSITLLPLAFEDLKSLLKLEFHHRDPFDRIIIAQSVANNLIIATNDKMFKQYGIKTLWK